MIPSKEDVEAWARYRDFESKLIAALDGIQEAFGMLGGVDIEDLADVLAAALYDAELRDA